MASRYIFHPLADHPQEIVAVFRAHEQVTPFGHVAVIVDPAGQDLTVIHAQGGGFGTAVDGALHLGLNGDGATGTPQELASIDVTAGDVLYITVHSYDLTADDVGSYFLSVGLQ